MRIKKLKEKIVLALVAAAVSRTIVTCWMM